MPHTRTHRSQQTTTTPPSTADALVRSAVELGAQLATQSARRDRDRELPHDAFAALRTLRIGALTVPRAHGGAGGTVTQLVEVAIALARGDSNVAQAFLAHYVFIERLRLMGSPEQCARLLPLAANGTLFGAAAAERGGHFRGELGTRLQPAGAHYRLDGTKHYSTGALYADLLKIRALDDQGRMVAAMIPADRAGITRIDDWNGMGQRTTASGTTELHNVHVAADEILPMYAWQGRRHHTGALAQIIHCAIDVGIALAALDDAVDWGRRGIRPVKESGVTRAQDDPYILQTVGSIATRAHGAQVFVLDAAREIETAAQARFGAADPTAESTALDHLATVASIATAQAKIISTEAALEASKLLFDVGGAATTLRSHNFDRHWRNARTHTTHDPVAYKFKAVGNYFLNDLAPPLSFSY